MGSFLSGRRGGRPLVERQRNIEVNSLFGSGNFEGWLSWHDAEGNCIANFQMITEGGEIRMTGTHDGRRLDQGIALTRTPCNYGGDRPWFGCPFCSRRCGKLYLGGDGFACRDCYGLRHASTRKDALTRLHLKKNRLTARLGKYEARPRGMHVRTHQAILAEIDDVQAKILVVFIAGARRILGSKYYYGEGREPLKESS